MRILNAMTFKIKISEITFLCILLLLTLPCIYTSASEKGNGLDLELNNNPILTPEVNPRVPLKGELVLEPSSNQIILFFPKQREEQTVGQEPGRPGITTEKKTFPNTSAETQNETSTGTITIHELQK